MGYAALNQFIRSMAVCLASVVSAHWRVNSTSAVLLLAFAFATFPSGGHAQGVEFGSGVLDSTKATSDRFRRVPFDSPGSGDYTITVSWDSDADVRYYVATGDGTRLTASAVRGSNPGVWTGALEANQEYFIGIWSNSGVANYSATIEGDSPPPISGNLFGQGLLDSTKATSDRFRRVPFDSPGTGDYTISVSWDSDADVRYYVATSDGTRLTASAVRGSNPGVWTGALEANQEYFIGIWSNSGTANYTATISGEGAAEPGTATVAIDTSPKNITVTEGDSATFTVSASGNGVLSYQWFVNGSRLTGETRPRLVLASVPTSADGNLYSVDVTDDNGTVTSDNAILTVEPDTSPISVVNLGQKTVDSEAGAGLGAATFNFDSLGALRHTIKVSWDSAADVRFNVLEQGNPTRLNSRGVRGPSPAVWSGDLVANQRYSIRVWSASGGVANVTATVEAAVPVFITRQPSDVIVTEGETATFSVEAAGSGDLTYQWLLGGVRIPGETSDTLVVFNTARADSGRYRVTVGSALGKVTSDVANLTVNEPLNIGLFSQEADESTWMLSGPAPTLDYLATATSDGWGQELLRIGDVLLVGGDFKGLKRRRSGAVTARPWLAAVDAVSGQPVSTFVAPAVIDSVVRALALSPSGDQVFVGGDFGLVALDAKTGALDYAVEVKTGGRSGRVFDIAVSGLHLYIGGQFNVVEGVGRNNIARLSLTGAVDPSWSPSVTVGFNEGRAGPVQSIALSPAEDVVYVGGNFRFINGIEVSKTSIGSDISLLALNASDGEVRPERFNVDVQNVTKALQARDIAVTDDYVIIAWGGPNLLSFHSANSLLEDPPLAQYRSKGDVQALQVVGNHVFVGHHGEFFGSRNNPIPPEAVQSLSPEIFIPYKMHSFRIDDPSFPVAQSWQIVGAFGIWGISVAEDGLWLAGQISSAGANQRGVDGLVRFPALD